MKLEILIRRQRYGESSTGTLKAWVVQEGTRGIQLLTSGLTNVKTARERLGNQFRGHDVTFVIDDDQEKKGPQL